jgi:hypothetical protein
MDTMYRARSTKRDTVILALCISKTGLYNIAFPFSYNLTPKDQLHISCYRFRNDTLNISTAWLVDKNYNSMFSLSSYPPYGPYCFPDLFSRSFRIIAFDEKGIPYISGMMNTWNAKDPSQGCLQLNRLTGRKDLEPLFGTKNGNE